MGRKSKLTPSMQKQIVQYIENGNTYERSCLLCGITYATFYNWQKQGEQAKSGKYFDFFNAVKKAEQGFIAHNVKIIMDAAENTWQAAAWLLERKYPGEFGRREHIHIDNKLDEVVKAFRDIK